MIKIAWKENYVLPLPENHPFPMAKYDLLPRQLMHEGLFQESQFFEPEVVTEDEILLTHTKEYWERLKNLQLTRKEENKIGFPQSAGMVQREIEITGGTIQLAYHALENGCGFNVAGGTHHAFTDHGEGYCLLNDNAVAAKILLEKKQVGKVLFVDLDVHQGNGTAEIFTSDERGYTFSMHGERNYPSQKMVSDLDIALKCKTGDSKYLKILEPTLEKLINSEKPDIIFYQAGVDVLEGDRFGRLSLTMNGCRQRDEIVFQQCSEHGIPVVVTMGGGYSRQIADIINAHTNTFKAAIDVLD